LAKEIHAQDIMIYFDNSGQIIIPSKLIEKSIATDDLRAIFKKVPFETIESQMRCVFHQNDLEAQRNQYIVVDKFAVGMHILSYRVTDFKSLQQSV
jgi:Ca2+-binding EF-hand superfamily protein